jgi:glycosyltransferase involved in cell wall biosynthesis
MKVLLASSSSGSRGGGELYLLYLGRALAHRGHEPVLWASTHERMDELARVFADVGPVVRCDYTNTYDRALRSLASFADRRSAARVAASWKGTGADLIHLNKQNLEDGLDLLRAARICGIPSLCTIHLSQSARYLRAIASGLRDFVSRRALRRYDGLLVSVLEQRRRDLGGFIGGSSRLRTIPNGVPLYDLQARTTIRTETRQRLRMADEHLVIVAVGRLVPQKRPLTFLDQAKLVCSRNSNARFIWVGDGAMAGDWDDRVRSYGLEDRVQRLPWQHDVVPLLFAADVFLHVAEFEGLPLAILEAMSAALPCDIASNLLAEMPFFGPEDVLPVTDDGRWSEVLEDRGRLLALGQRMRALAEAMFSHDAMAAKYEALYLETLSARK